MQFSRRPAIIRLVMTRAFQLTVLLLCLTGLAAEVVWTRRLSLLIGGTTYAGTGGTRSWMFNDNHSTNDDGLRD